MPTEICGVLFEFTRISSSVVQPGSVPGPGGYYDHYVCDGCKHIIERQVCGYVPQGELEKLYKAVRLHSEVCPELKNTEAPETMPISQAEIETLIHPNLVQNGDMWEMIVCGVPVACSKGPINNSIYAVAAAQSQAIAMKLTPILRGKVQREELK